MGADSKHKHHFLIGKMVQAEKFDMNKKLLFLFSTLYIAASVFSYTTKKAEAHVISPVPENAPQPVITIIPTPTPTVFYKVRLGKASYYSRAGCLGCSKTLTMANGEQLDDSKLTVAYNDAPLNSIIKITNIDNGKSVFAKVTDTGGFKRHGKIIDLTIATRDALGCASTCNVGVAL